jgi:hypothetical protein
MYESRGQASKNTVKPPFNDSLWSGAFEHLTEVNLKWK